MNLILWDIVVMVRVMKHKKMHWFDAVTMSFGTAGTGVFTIRNNNFAEYSTYSQIVTTIFMFLFGMNFNVFFFLLIGSFRQALV